MSNVRGEIFKGVIWLTSFRLIERGIAVVSTLILVRLLLPEDFGLVAMAMSIIVAVEVFTSFGFDVVLIQNQSATRSHYNTVWTFNVCLGVLIALGIVALAHPISWFYQDDRLVILLYAVAGTYFVGGLENVAVVDFRKYMEFHKEVIYRLIIKSVGFAVTIPTALVTRSYWALVAGMAAGSLTKVIVSFWMKPGVPKPTFSRAAEIFSYSGWLMLNNALFTIVGRAHDFIIGRGLGARSLGLFTVSMEISNIVSTELVAPINRAAFPGYAKLSKDMIQFRRTYLDIMACIMFISLPAAVGISATAELFVPIVLGDTWIDSIPIIKVLAIYGAVYSLTSNSIYVFHALAQPRRVTRLAVYQVAFLLPALFFGTREFGLIGAAWALLALAALCAAPLMWMMVSQALDMSVGQLMARWWRPVIGSTAMYFAVQWFIHEGPVHQTGSIADLLMVIAVGVCIYVTVVLLLWSFAGKPEGAERIVFSQLKSTLSRLRGIETTTTG